MPLWSGSALKKRGILFVAVENSNCRQSDETATFRAGQWESIESLLNRHRMLVVQRTGWGKSMFYFLATRLLRDGGEGVSLLISPLLSLMRNQLEAASRIGVRAAAINSSNTDEWKKIEQELGQDTINILLVSPERFATLRHCSDARGATPCCPWLWPGTRPVWTNAKYETA